MTVEIKSQIFSDDPELTDQHYQQTFKGPKDADWQRLETADHTVSQRLTRISRKQNNKICESVIKITEVQLIVLNT